MKGMNEVALVFAALLGGLFVGVSSIVPIIPSLSAYEVNRRKRTKQLSEHDQLRIDTHSLIVSLRRLLKRSLLILFTILIVQAIGWFFGAVAAILLASIEPKLSHLQVIRRPSHRLYAKYEQAILLFLQKHERFFAWLFMKPTTPGAVHLHSKEELLHVVSSAHDILSREEIERITSIVAFNDKTVEQIMTPKSVVDTISKDEILGPLVLDDLHKTGHSRFPVIDGDIDHVVGVLQLRDILTIDTTKRKTAKVTSAMDTRVHFIRNDHTLAQALAGFLSTRHHLFVVINEFRETVGIITLEDTLEALLGSRIVDEFDTHDDMRMVAERAAKHSTRNHSDNATDL